ncbi:succinate dehydrogenase [uncultured archaeon]|nr:succinate dehydrogenase [uncultured archaeon]HKJ97213.1 FAD-binding protein [Thermoplasmataceae archaeon]
MSEQSISDFTRIETDVLIIGAGGAGLRAAIEASDNGAKVVVLSKSLLGKAHTVMAEGGVAASLGNVDSKDNWGIHFADTVVEGVHLGDWRLAEINAKEAPDRIYELEKYGAMFDRTPDGRILQRAFGAHTYRRLCHVGDKTGLEMIRTLEDQVLHRDIKVHDETVVTKIFKKDGRAVGALAFEMRTGKFMAIKSKAVILATGGGGRLFKVTSNSWESTGDGFALAFDAGATLMDMEMVQFHPTGMVYPPGVRGMLVTEGVRGEGGILLNSKGERFMKTYSPNKMELDARDVVARSIYNEIQEGRGTEHGGVYLQIHHKGAKFILDKLPGMHSQFLEFAGVDITKENMEVAPTTHYYMGGIKIDPEDNQTTLPGLFACGEAATGLHGANRLGGNSLIDLLVFGRRTGQSAAKYTKDAQPADVSENDIIEEISRVTGFLNKPSAVNPYELINELRDTMSKYAGIRRTEENLTTALDILLKIKGRYSEIGVAGNVRFNPGLIACFELHSLLTTGELLLRGAIQRKESRGAHFRSDYPKMSEEFKRNITWHMEGNEVKSSFSTMPELPPEMVKIVGQVEGHTQ